jgi:biotin carboxyl carrier protein
MKKLRITVNEKVYDVVVQVLEDDEATMSGAGFLSPLPPVMVSPPPAPGPRQVAPPSSPPTPHATAPSSGPPGPIKGDPNAILAPIAGVVQKVYVQAGGSVDAKAPVVLLDAMKMDTYIYAPRAGRVSAVAVAVGDAVQVGDPLIRYEPEA